MQEEQRFIQRCLELAAHGMGRVAPNPMVGCVIVLDDKIIGEGYHEYFGGPHAEVMAMADALHKHPQEALKDATLYVNLEPCSHLGKTPPCTELLVARGIKKVVVGSLDPFEQRSGSGIRILKQAGIDVTYGILEKESDQLNKRFITFHKRKRPFILFKYARSADGFMAPHPRAGGRFWISGEESRKLVHKWRTEETGIMVGSNTARIDNPQLTARYWSGKNPIRMVVDRKGDLPRHLYLFDESVPTIVFSVVPGQSSHHVEYVTLPDSSDFLEVMMNELHNRNIMSVMIEGGRGLLDAFIQANLWDEARIFTSTMKIGEGIEAPDLQGEVTEERMVGNDRLTYMIQKNL
ncbi:MAG: bifunctional diaminohydroxyphosphoribosylaminopyrimidine deaminase/5-amino-6-(5-phosphoribosylamino)uracil reductase RibD [Bacteroidota bacterium]